MKKAAYIAFFIALILLIPFGVQQLISYRQLPSSITIATGKEGGRYKVIAKALGAEIKEKYGIEVHYRYSPGSESNIRYVEEGKADFALFQPNVMTGRGNYSNVRMVANVFPEVVVCHVTKDLSYDPFLGNPVKGEKTTIAVGEEGSGDVVTSAAILDYFKGASLQQERLLLNYQGIVKGFKAGDIDFAIVTSEENAPIQKEIAGQGTTKIISLPFADSFVARNPDFHKYSIPSGFYGVWPRPYPEQDTTTIAINAQLITAAGVSSSMVTAVAGILMDPEFLVRNKLSDLRTRGEAYARATPSLPFHSGADHFYDPELKPLLNPDFVDSTESLRSFFVSILIAFYLFFRWLKNRRRRQSEHFLDKFLRRLLNIEKDQVELDEQGSSGDEIVQLEKLLDEVTALRREALTSFSVNDFRDDSGMECFLMLSSSLSEKINAKLTRQRLCHEISRLGK
ncbi:MAG: TAXI family TRAP transporter solute-binding subunit [Verrucomicrobiaceae bacterium]|nr:TAXI family TRAP transporter solute-binding subunit [Verrucomicrobiaceae bacterium]